MKVVYCASCGTKLYVYRKGLPKYGKVIDVIQQHFCTDTPVPLDLTPSEAPPFEAKGKFIQNLNELSPPPLPRPDEGLQDRRPPEQLRKEISSSAPRNLRSQIFGLTEPDDNG